MMGEIDVRAYAAKLSFFTYMADIEHTTKYTVLKFISRFFLSIFSVLLFLFAL